MTTGSTEGRGPWGTQLTSGWAFRYTTRSQGRPDTFYGDRAGQFIDLYGHRWGVFKHLRTVAPEEIVAAAAEMFGR
ncbi:hypothetical protein ABZ942_18880 [Nocardia sp. NPDC046473]|uniref:hypothetical protein n=1 Tax=Nocardia sp. NPDC046473 TaxID=3155733 RepID=UPI003406226E